MYFCLCLLLFHSICFHARNNLPIYYLTFHTYNCKIKIWLLKPSNSSNSKLRTTPRKIFCFDYTVLSCKAKHLRSLVQAMVLGFERLEILGLSIVYLKIDLPKFYELTPRA